MLKKIALNTSVFKLFEELNGILNLILKIYGNTVVELRLHLNVWPERFELKFLSMLTHVACFMTLEKLPN